MNGEQSMATESEMVGETGNQTVDVTSTVPAAMESPDAGATSSDAGEPGSDTSTEGAGSVTDAALGEPAITPSMLHGTQPGETTLPTGETPPIEELGEGDRPRRKIQLNPTVDSDQLRAIPTYAAEGDTNGEAGSQGHAAPHLQAPAGPVEVPRTAPLEATLEAELTEAMAGAMSAQPAAPGEAGSEVSALPQSEDLLEPGTRLKAKVQSLNAESVFCEVGYRAPGLVPVKQFPPGKQPRIGEEFLVVVDKYDAENGVIHVSLPKATRRPRGNWEELAVGQVVECYVNKTNKGGLEVTVSNLRAFLPASQVDFGFVSSLEPYVGQRFAVQITEVNASKRNLVVSRRAILIHERKEAAANFWQSVEVGQQFSGNVKTLKDYGAFIDLGGVDGFLHVGEMSWTRIKHPGDILQEGQPVDVVILSLDREKQKIGLGMRQLAQNPWNLAVDKYAVGTQVTGKVTRTTDFGAFIELEAGVEGLIHISELDHKRVKRVGDVLNVGQEITVQVLEVAPDRQRISLSLKALKAKPEEPKDEDLSPGKGQAYERKRKEPLRGGTGSTGAGGLFGNPTDFGR